MHERVLEASEQEVGGLIDGLAGPDDRLWPRGWPPMRLDRPLAAGARGGHGPIRYTVSEHIPGRRVVFAFTAPRGLDGEHRFEALWAGLGLTCLRHTVTGSATGLMRLGWPLILRPLHDALLDDCLDGAERALCGQQLRSPMWSARVRLLRALLRRGGGHPDPSRR